MKYLLIRKPPVGATPPTAEMVRERKKYVLDKVKKGVSDCADAFAGGGGCSTINADTPEKLNELLWAGPMARFYDYDVRPSSDYGSFMEAVYGLDRETDSLVLVRDGLGTGCRA